MVLVHLYQCPICLLKRRVRYSCYTVWSAIECTSNTLNSNTKKNTTKMCWHCHHKNQWISDTKKKKTIHLNLSERSLIQRFKYSTSFNLFNNDESTLSLFSFRTHTSSQISIIICILYSNWKPPCRAASYANALTDNSQTAKSELR